MKRDVLRLRGFERFLPTKTHLGIFIWKPGQVGKYTSLVMRPLTAPKRTDMCIYPDRKGPRHCG
jgi:hypothetical protein